MAVCCATIISQPAENCQPKRHCPNLAERGCVEDQPQAVLHRHSRKLTPLMKLFIEFLKSPE